MKLLRKHDSSVKPVRIHHAVLCLEKNDAAIVHLNHCWFPLHSLSGGLGLLKRFILKGQTHRKERLSTGKTRLLLFFTN